MFTIRFKELVLGVAFLLAACGSNPTEPVSNGQNTSVLVSVSNFQAIAGNRQASLSWANPSDASFKGVLVMRKTGGNPAGPSDGIEVYRGNGNSKIDTGLSNDSTYFYAIFTFDAAGSYSTGVSASCTPSFDAQNVIFVTISGGTFEMGDVEDTGYPADRRVHTVTVSDFMMSSYEVTKAQYVTFLNTVQASGDITVTDMIWQRVTGASGEYKNQSYFYYGLTSILGDNWISFSSNGLFSVVSGKENWPVVGVTWYGAKAFASYYGYDLPTESEWEYACRGGKQYKYGTDDGTYSNIKGNFGFASGALERPVNVGSYPANPFGLYDMSGNVAEWCNDWYGIYPNGSVTNPLGNQEGSSRVIRGGSWYLTDSFCLSSFRAYKSLSSSTDNLGFRVVKR